MSAGNYWVIGGYVAIIPGPVSCFINSPPAVDLHGLALQHWFSFWTPSNWLLVNGFMHCDTRIGYMTWLGLTYILLHCLLVPLCYYTIGRMSNKLFVWNVVGRVLTTVYVLDGCCYIIALKYWNHFHTQYFHKCICTYCPTIKTYCTMTCCAQPPGKPIFKPKLPSIFLPASLTFDKP